MTDKQALFLINKSSRKGSDDIAEAVELLHRHGMRILKYYPSGAAEMDTLIARHCEDADLVLLAGGDGTLSCAAESLVAAGLPLGILPMGTANDLARTLQIPLDPVAAAKVVINGKTSSIDLGSVNGILFFNAASIGLGTKVTRHLSKDMKGRWGMLSYVRSVYNVFKSNRSFRAKIYCDGEMINIRSIQIAVGNGRFYGGGMAIKDDAAINDQRLDLYSIKPQKFWKLLSLAPALRTGQFDSEPYVDVISGHEIEVYTRRKKSVSADGELSTQTPAKFHVLPKALQVFVP